eukprot:TRINITY_DN12892_c0_g2_i1.p1 TRINITY_DN12892_c0_g2~~TRINITY_DN12892_c0_g2_i1.p1  ORF type:complete len:282 (-),score=26.13 TRINITY_DN12892_c0_g2_i1:8-853(-)
MGCANASDWTALGSTYELGPALGRGAFGEVRMARKAHSQEHLAVKITRVGNEEGELKQNRLKWSREEALLLSRVTGHPNCLMTFDFIHENLCSYLFMERCKSSLLQAIQTTPSTVDNDIIRILRQMLSAIAHCHGKGIAHRDVKPDNFMFGGENGETLKLCDFDLAKAIPEEGYMTGVCGTAPYMAPEIVCCTPYTERVDVWSVGVVAYRISFGRCPYVPKKKGSEAIKAMIRNGNPAPRFTSDERGSFLRKLMERSKDNRCSASDALQSKFLEANRVTSE